MGELDPLSLSLPLMHTCSHDTNLLVMHACIQHTNPKPSKKKHHALTVTAATLRQPPLKQRQNFGADGSYYPKIGPAQLSIQSQLSYIRAQGHIAVPSTLFKPQGQFPSDDYRITAVNYGKKQSSQQHVPDAKLKGRSMQGPCTETQLARSSASAWHGSACTQRAPLIHNLWCMAVCGSPPWSK